MVFPALVCAMAFLFPLCDLEVQNQKLEELDLLEQVAYWRSFVATHYLINVLVLLGVTTLMKKYFARPRPTPPENDADGKPAPNKRYFDMRTRETNCSFPSGDAAQAALYMTFYMLNFPHAFKLVGGPIGAMQFVVTVSCARVYFHCHYAGDTMCGALVGIVLCQLMFRTGLKAILQQVFLSAIGSDDDSILSEDM